MAAAAQEEEVVAGGRRLNFWGNDPEDEQEYYASQNIRSTKSYFQSPSTGQSLFTRCWVPPLSPSLSPPRGLVFMVHGYGNDISWTFQATPIFLAQHGFACYALDLPGHGRSYGLKAFVPDLNAVIDDCVAYFNSVLVMIQNQHRDQSHQEQEQEQDDDDVHHSSNKKPKPKMKCFLYGESMGGAICLLIHLLRRDFPLSTSLQAVEVEMGGAVLAAPMCKISEKIRPRWPIPTILTFAARFLPTLPVVPTADLVDKSVKVQEKRAVAASNPSRYTGKPRLGTVLELLRATDDLSARLADITIPFLVLHGSADVVTDPEVSRELYERASSRDKTIKIYQGMMHSLLFGETDGNVNTVRSDILGWLNQRC